MQVAGTRTHDADDVDDVNAPLPEWVKHASRFTHDPLEVARSLRPVFEQHAAEQDRTGRLTDETVRALCESGLLGLLVPRELGGIEADPALYIDVIEELSYADGSLGWVTMASSFTTMGAAAWAGPALVEAMFDRGSGFGAAGHIAPNGTAERVDGGYRISGQFHFGSGSQISSFFMGAFVLHEGGAPVRNDNGAPNIIWAFGPASRCISIRRAGTCWACGRPRATTSVSSTRWSPRTTSSPCPSRSCVAGPPSTSASRWGTCRSPSAWARASSTSWPPWRSASSASTGPP